MTAHELTLGVTLSASRAGSMSAHVAPSLLASEYCFVLHAVTQVGDVAPAGTTTFDAADSGPAPFTLTAVTLKV